MLAECLQREPLGPEVGVLDLCTGSGLLAITAARRGWRATAVDASRRAVFAARLNALLNGTWVHAVRGSLFEPVAGRAFDLIVSNPPYVPAESDDLPTRGPARAWDAGPRGRALLDPIIDAAPAHLKPGGSLLVVHSSVIGIDDTLRRLRAGGLRPDVVAHHRGPFGPLMHARARQLEERGLIAAGERVEDVVVVRGTLPRRRISANTGMNARPALAV